MQPIDPHTLFSIFEQGDEQVYRDSGVEDTLNNPFVLMGTVLNGLENYNLMDILFTKKYGEEYDNIRDSVKYKYYVRMYNYLNRIDNNSFDEKHDIGTAFDHNAVIGALAVLLKFFEGIEHYRKCAVIKRYLDYLLENVYKKVAPLI